jgi:mannose-1-phosphate guanylyltransferase
MKAIILAGGKGTRLRPLTCNTTKVMVPLLNRPFLEHLIDYLKKYNISDIILTLGYLPEQIRNYFGDGGKFGVKITYLVEDSPLGSAGAVKNAERYLDSSFIVFNGDIFTDFNLSNMIEQHYDRKAIATIALTPVDNPTIYGVVETDSQGRVRCFKEKPSWDEVTTNMINAGIYILEPGILSYIPPNIFFTFERDIFPAFIERRRVIYGYSFEAYWTDIGTPELYLKLHRDLLNHLGKSVRFEGKSSVHPSAQIEGPVVIGEGCFIGKHSVIRGPVVIGPRCHVKEDAIVEGAVLWQNCKVGSRAKLRNCVLASNCCIGEETEVLDNCVLGDNVRIERGNKLSQGVRIWPNNGGTGHNFYSSAFTSG